MNFHLHGTSSILDCHNLPLGTYRGVWENNAVVFSPGTSYTITAKTSFNRDGSTPVRVHIEEGDVFAEVLSSSGVEYDLHSRPQAE